MRFLWKRVFACLELLLLSHLALCQISMGVNDIVYSTNETSTVKDTNHIFVIHDIAISGNNRTKPAIILRELPFKVNEEYPLSAIVQQFKKARKQLMNTGLFRDVIVSLKNVDGTDMEINVEVVEKWYVWPNAFIKPVDKSFGEWWNEKDRNMDRINYGIRLSHNNITGNNDKLRISLMNGYTRQVSLQYYGLWLDKELKWSTNGGVSYGQNKEVNYMTLDNKQVPVKSNNEFLRSNVGGFFQLNYRPAIKTIHTFGLGYTYENIADTVLKLNPSFSSDAHTVQYPELFYKLAYFNVDYNPYPTKGFMGEVWLKRKGLGMKSSINLWELTVKASQTWPINSKLFFNLKGIGMIKLPFVQPYITKQLVGYEGRYLQGYEYYVIDGVAGAYAKASLSRILFSTHINITSQRFRWLNNIPVKMYAKTFVNTGYVYNTVAGDNKLTNTPLYSGGFGLDLVSFNDFVIKIEWSFNRLGENGLYLHQRNDF
jgi:outer membrane protein assembly factor BamA